jgi:hypothetical protein
MLYQPPLPPNEAPSGNALRANDHETSESEEFSLGASDRDRMVMPNKDVKSGGARGGGPAGRPRAAAPPPPPPRGDDA